MSRLTLVRISVQGFEGSGFTTLKLQGEETVQQVKNTVLGKIQSKGLTGDGTYTVRRAVVCDM
jgi:hypothetical protein